MVLTDGAGFAGFALWGFGMGPDGPDYMAVGDLSTLHAAFPGCRAMRAWSATARSRASPIPIARASCCKRQLARLAERGLTLYVGIEPEFMLLGARCQPESSGPSTPPMTSTSPATTTRACRAPAACSMRSRVSLRSVGIDVYQIDHEDANGQFEVNFTYADALKSADNFTFVKMAASEIARKHGMIAHVHAQAVLEPHRQRRAFPYLAGQRQAEEPVRGRKIRQARPGAVRRWPINSWAECWRTRVRWRRCARPR